MLELELSEIRAQKASSEARTYQDIREARGRHGTVILDLEEPTSEIKLRTQITRKVLSWREMLSRPDLDDI